MHKKTLLFFALICVQTAHVYSQKPNNESKRLGGTSHSINWRTGEKYNASSNNKPLKTIIVRPQSAPTADYYNPAKKPFGSTAAVNQPQPQNWVCNLSKQSAIVPDKPFHKRATQNRHRKAIVFISSMRS